MKGRTVPLIQLNALEGIGKCEVLLFFLHRTHCKAVTSKISQ
jgi:hypothetical protein